MSSGSSEDVQKSPVVEAAHEMISSQETVGLALLSGFSALLGAPHPLIDSSLSPSLLKLLQKKTRDLWGDESCGRLWQQAGEPLDSEQLRFLLGLLIKHRSLDRVREEVFGLHRSL